VHVALDVLIIGAADVLLRLAAARARAGAALVAATAAKVEADWLNGDVPVFAAKEGGGPDADEQEQPRVDDVYGEGGGKRQRCLTVRRVALPVFLLRRHTQGRGRSRRFSLRRHGTPSSRTRPTPDYPTAPVGDKHEIGPGFPDEAPGGNPSQME